MQCSGRILHPVDIGHAVRTSVRFGESHTYNSHVGNSQKSSILSLFHDPVMGEKIIKGSTGFELLCPVVSYRIMSSMPPVVIGYKPRQL